MTPSRDRAGWPGGAGQPDSLVEVRLRLFALDRGGEGVDGFIRTEHGGVPHRVVSLGREGEAASLQAPRHTARVSPHYLKYHYTKARQHRQLTQDLASLPQNSISQLKTEVNKLKRNGSGKELLGIYSVRCVPGADHLCFSPRDLLQPWLGLGGGCRCPWGERAPGDRPLLKVIRHHLQHPGTRQSAGRLQSYF